MVPLWLYKPLTDRGIDVFASISVKCLYPLLVLVVKVHHVTFRMLGLDLRPAHLRLWGVLLITGFIDSIPFSEWRNEPSIADSSSVSSSIMVMLEWSAGQNDPCHVHV